MRATGSEARRAAAAAKRHAEARHAVAEMASYDVVCWAGATKMSSSEPGGPSYVNALDPMHVQQVQECKYWTFAESRHRPMVVESGSSIG